MNPFKKDVKKEFEEVVRFVFKDGLITEHQMELLFKKAKSLGVDEVDAELIIESIKKDRFELKSVPDCPYDDGFLISNEELLLRVGQWVSRCSENKIKMEVETFPRNAKDTGALDKYLDMASKVGSAINLKGVASALPIPGASLLVGGALSILGMNKTRQVEHNEIVGITEKYLLILELRAPAEPVLNAKFVEFKDKLAEKLKTKSEKKGLFGW